MNATYTHADLVLEATMSLRSAEESFPRLIKAGLMDEEEATRKREVRTLILDFLELKRPEEAVYSIRRDDDDAFDETMDARR